MKDANTSITCKGCGECCKWLGISMPFMSPYLEDYYRKRGCKIDGNIALVPSRCPHLNGRNKCDLHESGKPQACRDFNGKNSGHYVHDKCVWSK